MKAQYARIIKALWQAHVRCDEIREDKFKLLNGTYKVIYKVSSKEYRELLNGQPKLTIPKIAINVNIHDDEGRWTVKSYFSKVRKLANTRHKNTLLRIWNGDCLSYTRLIHLQLVDSNLCPNCAELDTPLHTLVNCQVAEQIWTKLMIKIPKCPNTPMVEYVIGLYDGKVEMSIKAEIMKMLMHFRNMTAEAIYRRLKNYFLTTNSKNEYIKYIFDG
jgi:hypothetical protein